MIDTSHVWGLDVAVLKESAVVVHTRPSGTVEDHDFHFLVFVVDTSVKGVVHGSCMDEDDVNTSLEVKSFDDTADGDDDAVAVHNNRWGVIVPTVDAGNDDGNSADVMAVKCVLPYS